MPAKEQEALFRRALLLQQTATEEFALRKALSLYAQAISAGSATLPLCFNSASICLSLSVLVSSPAEAASFREAAATHLNEALIISPANLEALMARAAVEDAYARAAEGVAQVRLHRETAAHFLRKGVDAEPTSDEVHMLLAEALVLQAEACAEPVPSSTVITSLLSDARPLLRQAVWLLQQRIADLERMRTDPAALAEARRRLLQVYVTDGKVALAEMRLAGWISVVRLKEAEDAFSKNELDVADAEALLIRAELLEGLSEHAGDAEKEILDRGLEVCRAAVAAFERSAETDQDGQARRVEAYTLLGDLCLARLRGEMARERVCALLATGASGYEAAIGAGKGPENVETANETFYNLACLVVLGMAKGCEARCDERQIAELLKKSVDKRVVDFRDLTMDQDLTHIKSKTWFAKLLEYASKASRREAHT